MLQNSSSGTKLDRTRNILNMLDPRTDSSTRLIALDQVDRILKTLGLEWGDLAPLLTKKDPIVKVYPGGLGLPTEPAYQPGFKIKQL